MIRLTADDIEKAGRFIRKHGRAIEIARFEMHFGNPDKHSKARHSVVQCLRGYQNPDGGFGRWLENDFMLPASSAMATSLALRYLGALLPRS